MKSYSILFILLSFCITHLTHANEQIHNAQHAMLLELEQDDMDNKNEQTSEPADLFPGTLYLNKNMIMLHRCTSGGDQYILDFPDQALKQKTLELMKNNKKMWLNIVGVFKQENEQYHLIVQDITDLHLNETCHLSELLDEMSNNPK